MRASPFISFVCVIMAAALPVSANGHASATDGVGVELTETGAILVPVVVNGDHFRFLLDTGSNRSAVSNGLVARLGLAAIARTSVVSSRGTTSNDVVHITDLTLGTLAIHDVLASVVPDLQLGAIASGLDGIIGQDVLVDANYTLDYRHKRLTWDNPASSEVDGSIHLMLRREEGRYLVALPQSTKEGDVLWLVPDSGASAFVLFTHDGAPRLRTTPLHMPADAVTVSGSDVVQGARIIALRVGATVFENRPALIIDRRDHDAPAGDGLLPLCAFASVTFNARGGYLMVRAR